MERWRGRVAVVTGASSGIGADTARTLAEKGIIVVALARREEKLQELLNSKGEIHIRKCDVSKEEDVTSTFSWIEETLGGVDILINNAATFHLTGLMNCDSEDWRSVLDTNVLGLSMCTREALKTMRTRGDNGHIININSILGHVIPQRNVPFGMYPASKYAVTALTETLRLELIRSKSNIKITSISPGSVISEMSRRAAATLHKHIPPGVTPPVHLQPEDVAEAIVYSLGTKPSVQVHEITIHPLGQMMV